VRLYTRISFSKIILLIEFSEIIYSLVQLVLCIFVGKELIVLPIMVGALDFSIDLVFLVELQHHENKCSYILRVSVERTLKISKYKINVLNQ